MSYRITFLRMWSITACQEETPMGAPSSRQKMIIVDTVWLGSERDYNRFYDWSNKAVLCDNNIAKPESCSKLKLIYWPTDA